MSLDTHHKPPPAPDDDADDLDVDDELTASPVDEPDGNVRRPAPPDDAATVPAASAKTDKDKTTAAKSTGTTGKVKAEDKMIPVGPLGITVAGGTVLAAGMAAQYGAEIGGPLGALLGAGMVVVAASTGYVVARGGKATTRKGSSRRSMTRAGMNAAQSGGIPSAKHWRGPKGKKIKKGRPVDLAAAGAAVPGVGGSTASGLGKLRRGGKVKTPKAPHVSGAGSTSIPGGSTRGARGPRNGGASWGGWSIPRGSSRTPGSGRSRAGSGPGAGFGGRGSRGSHATSGARSGGHGFGGGSGFGGWFKGARTAAGAGGRVASAPFKALGAGIDGVRKNGKSMWSAGSAARKKALKNHRAANGHKKGTRHPFRGWGAAASGAGIYMGGRLWKLIRRMWMWNPWNEELAAMDAAEAAAAKKQQGQGNGAHGNGNGKPSVNTGQPQPNTNTSPPDPVTPPAQPTNSTSGGSPMHGKPQSGVPTVDQLVTISEELLTLATRRAAPGARPGLLEVVADSKKWPIILENIRRAMEAEAKAWERFPVHKSIPAMYAAVNQNAQNAARAMASIPATIERIEKDRLDALRNPPQNAQMLDHSVNGYAGGQG